MAVGKFIKYGIVTGVAVAGAVVAYKNRKKIKAKTVDLAEKVENKWNGLDNSTKRVVKFTGCAILFGSGFLLGLTVMPKVVFDNYRDSIIDGHNLFKSGYVLGWFEGGGENPITPSEMVQSAVAKFDEFDKNWSVNNV